IRRDPSNAKDIAGVYARHSTTGPRRTRIRPAFPVRLLPPRRLGGSPGLRAGDREMRGCHVHLGTTQTTRTMERNMLANHSPRKVVARFLAGALTLLGLAAAPASAQDCDRDCMRDLITQ